LVAALVEALARWAEPVGASRRGALADYQIVARFAGAPPPSRRRRRGAAPGARFFGVLWRARTALQAAGRARRARRLPVRHAGRWLL